MSTYRTIKEYQLDYLTHGRQRFLVLNPTPVLLLPNPAAAPKPQNPGSSGFMTRAVGGPTSPAVPSRKPPLVVNDTFLVIPVIKGEGHPFPERIGVGRTKGTDIMLGDREVSKYHGYFSVDKERWYFTDAGSSNGTFIKGERLTQMVATPVNDDTEIGLGTLRCVFRTAAGFCEYVCR
jgi:hypothetical protein